MVTSMTSPTSLKCHRAALKVFAAKMPKNAWRWQIYYFRE
jgi:hypothetical protein